MQEATEIYMKNINNSTITKNDYILANSIDIKEQDLGEFTDISGGVNAMISSTGSGKTTILKHILSVVHNKYDVIILMSRTARLQKAYDFFPRDNIVDDYDEELMTTIWNTQLEDHEKGKKLDKVMVILDDVIASPSFKKSKMIEEMAFSARHLNITMWILSQNYTSIKPGIRNNIRILVSFWLESKKEREKVIEQFLSTINNRVGSHIFKAITGTKYQAIIISNYKVGVPFEEKVKKFIADPNVKIRMESKKKKEKSTNYNLMDTRVYIEETKNGLVQRIKEPINARVRPE